MNEFRDAIAKGDQLFAMCAKNVEMGNVRNEVFFSFAKKTSGRYF
jgi:hypothetical protein